jgi:ribosomal protein L10
MSMLLGVMKAPIQKFVATLAEPLPKLARTSPPYATRNRPLRAVDIYCS